MKYQILSGTNAGTVKEAISVLENKVQEALNGGAQLAGGVSIVHGVPAVKAGIEGYSAFQAVLLPDGTDPS